MSPRLRILIADDEAHHCVTLAALLRDLGHEVVAMAEDGKRAVALARSSVPDLAILDFRMPGLTGPEAAKRIVSERAIPVIVVSASNHEVELDAASQAPIFHHLTKPFDARELAPAITIACSRFADWQRERSAREEAERKLEERKLIERAKGLIMRVRGLAEDEAYNLLRRTSQDRNIRLADLARQVLRVYDGPDVRAAGEPAEMLPARRRVRQPRV